MATAITINGSVTLDESSGLQNTGVPAGAEDNNDSDVAFSIASTPLPTSFSNRLFNSAANGGLGLSTTFATNNGVAESASNFIQVSAGSGSTVASLGFVKDDGSALPVYAGVATGGVATGLSAVNGGAISLFADATLGNRMVLGLDANNDIVFAIFMDPNAALTSSRVWTVQFEAISNPIATNPDDPVDLTGFIDVAATTSLSFTFDELHSGSNLFGAVGTTTNSVIVIAEHPKLKADGTLDSSGQVIKTSQGGTGATIGVDSQMFDPGEGAYFTYSTGSVDNFLAGNLSQTEANDSHSIQYGGTQTATSASATISQTQGPDPAAMTIAAFDVAGTPQQTAFVNGLIDGTGIGASVPITSVTIHKANGTTESETAGGPDTSTHISFASGIATVSGLGSGDEIEWTTTSPHDRALIKGVAGKFDIGKFEIAQATAAHEDIGAQLRFEDDGPSITATAGGPTLTVDETVFATDATGSFAAQFNAVFGADGQGATPVSYALSTPGGASGLTDTATGASVELTLESGQVVGRAGAGGPIVFVVSVDSSGNVTLDQRRAVVHPDASNPDDSKTLSSASLVVLTTTATDKDGDQASAPLNIGQQLVFKDDGPSITATAGGPTLTVDETVLATDATGSFVAQFNAVFGADGQGATPVSYALSTPGGASGLTDTATGQSVQLFKEGANVVGRAGSAAGAIVFVVSVDSSGVVTLDQRRAVVHPTTDPDESKTLSAASLVVLTATATDADGDQASAPLNIGQQLVFKDDGPAIGPIDNSTVNFAANASATKTLNGAVGADPNAAPYTVVSFNSPIFIPSINNTELHGIASNNNTTITYWADTSGDTIFGNAGDTGFYKLELSQTANSGAGSYTFTVLVDPPPAVLEFTFDELHSGSNLFGAVGDVANSIIVIAEHPKLKADGTLDTSGQVIKTSQGGTGATIGVDSQMFDPGEGAFFTYGKGSDPNFLAANLSQTEADNSASINYSGGTQNATGASATISQTQGPDPATMTIAAFDVADAPQQKAFVDGISTGTGIGASVPITSVTIHKANGSTESETAGGPDTSTHISFAASVATASGLGSGDEIEWTTSSPHDRALIKGVAGKFDIGKFEIIQAQPTAAQDLPFTVQATDGDSDFAQAPFNVHINPVIV